jgi:hypothetical protein
VLTGKHAREKRRKKENKYKQHSRVRDDMDPLDELLLKAERANNPEKFKEEEAEARRREQRRVLPHNCYALTVTVGAATIFVEPVPDCNRGCRTCALYNRIRDEYEYPGVEEIDPYDPGTFGFIEAGVVLGAHGVDGVIKVRATSEIGEEALSYPGLRHMKVRAACEGCGCRKVSRGASLTSALLWCLVCRRGTGDTLVR